MTGKEAGQAGGGPQVEVPVEERPERFFLRPGLSQRVAQEDRREDEDPVVFGGDGQPAQKARQHIIAPAPLLADEHAKIERQREKKRHRDVERDLMAEQDGDKGDGIQERGDQAFPRRIQAPADRMDDRDRRRPEKSREQAGGEQNLVEREREKVRAPLDADESEERRQSAQDDGDDVVEEVRIVIDEVGPPVALVVLQDLPGDDHVVHPLVARGQPGHPEERAGEHDEEEQDGDPPVFQGVGHAVHERRIII